MISCPNKNLPSWLKLDSLIPDISNYVWNKLLGEISDDGKPIGNLERFNRILSQNNNDYKKTYLQFLNVSEKNITKEELIGNIDPIINNLLSEGDKALIEDLQLLDRAAEIKHNMIVALESKLNKQIKIKL